MITQAIPLGDDQEAPPEGIDPAVWYQWKDWERLPPNDFIHLIMRGMEGRNIGLDMGLTGMNKYFHGIHPARYYLIGSDSGNGKTTFADFVFVIKAWNSAKKQGKKIKIFYCSFEIGKTYKKAVWVVHYIFWKYKVQLPVDYILGFIDGKLLSKEHLKLVIKATKLVDEMWKDITFLEEVVHPMDIFNDLVVHHFSKVGKVERAKQSADDKKLGRLGAVKSYTPDDPDFITMIIIDHLSLIGDKAIMDMMSKYLVVLRNMFHIVACVIQQFSTDLMSWQRNGKKNENALIPQRLDFGDSKAPYRDADGVLGLIRPVTFSYDKFQGYTILGDDSLGDTFLATYIMKNRYGRALRMLPLFFNGLSGHLYDLPLQPSNLMAMQEFLDMKAEIERVNKLFE